MSDEQRTDHIPNEEESESQKPVDGDATQTPADHVQGDDAAQQDGISEVDQLKKELEEMKHRAALAQADLVNARKRMEKDKEEFVKFANTNCINAMLPVLDNLDRAINYLPEAEKDTNLGKGVQAVVQQFLDAFKGLGVERIEAKIGEVYDPNHHEAVMQGEGEKDTILEVMEHGYQLHGRVLRPTKVKVGM